MKTLKKPNIDWYDTDIYIWSVSLEVTKIIWMESISNLAKFLKLI